jgi:hypothetical protein
MTLTDDKVHHFYLKKLAETDLSLAIETVICDWNIAVAQITGHFPDPFSDPASVSASDKLLDWRFLPYSENFNSLAEIMEESKPPPLCISHRQSSFKRPAYVPSERIARKDTFAYQSVWHCYDRDKSDNRDNACSNGSFTERLSYSPPLCKLTLPRALVDACVEQAAEEVTGRQDEWDPGVKSMVELLSNSLYMGNKTHYTGAFLSHPYNQANSLQCQPLVVVENLQQPAKEAAGP